MLHGRTARAQRLNGSPSARHHEERTPQPPTAQISPQSARKPNTHTRTPTNTPKANTSENIERESITRGKATRQTHTQPHTIRQKHATTYEQHTRRTNHHIKRQTHYSAFIRLFAHRHTLPDAWSVRHFAQFVQITKYPHLFATLTKAIYSQLLPIITD